MFCDADGLIPHVTTDVRYNNGNLDPLSPQLFIQAKNNPLQSIIPEE